jgi:phospholipid/cholesterol/gamma-HCH transport system substrate-binding protein
MNQAIKVGFFATICLVVLAVLVWKVEDWNPFTHSSTHHLEAVFPSVAGLDEKAAVRVAGVRVGKVDTIGLAPDGRSARVTLVLEHPLALTQGARARITDMGLLGDKYVEIIPGREGAPLLPPGTVLHGSAPVSFDDAMAKLDSIGDSIQSAVGSFSGGPGGSIGGNINSLVQDLQKTSEEIRALVAENRTGVASSVRNIDLLTATLSRELPRIADQTQHALDQVAAVIAENRENVKGSTGNIKELTDKLQASVDNLNGITGTINSGQGTVGKLVKSDEAYNRVVGTLDSIKGGVDTLGQSLGAINKFKVTLDLHGAVLQDQPQTFGSSLSGLDAIIDPTDGVHLYKIGIESTPYGSFHERRDTYNTFGASGSLLNSYTVQELVSENRLQVNAELGFHGPYDLRLWGGLIEGRGGAELEAPVPFWKRPIWLQFQAFDFTRPNGQSPHLRATAKWHFSPNLYVQGGYDDFLVNKALFFGAGITWKDDNLKYLLGAAKF